MFLFNAKKVSGAVLKPPLCIWPQPVSLANTLSWIVRNTHDPELQKHNKQINFYHHKHTFGTQSYGAAAAATAVFLSAFHFRSRLARVCVLFLLYLPWRDTLCVPDWGLLPSAKWNSGFNRCNLVRASLFTHQKLHNLNAWCIKEEKLWMQTSPKGEWIIES